MGFLGTVFQNGLALGHYSGEHTVHGSAHADLIKEDVCTVHLLGAHGDHAVVHAVLCAQSTEHLQVLVNGAGAEVAASGHGHLSLSKTGQQCAQKVVAGAHLAGQVVRDVGAGQMGGVDLVGVAVNHFDLCAQNAEDLQAHRHITDIRQILDHTDIRCQNGCRQDAHRRILAPEMVTSPCRGLPPVITNFSNFMISLSEARSRRPVKVPESIFHKSCLMCMGHKAVHVQLSYYTQLSQKAKPRLVLFYYFLFCPFSRRIFQNFDFFFRYFTKPDTLLLRFLYQMWSSHRVSVIQPS